MKTRMAGLMLLGFYLIAGAAWAQGLSISDAWIRSLPGNLPAGGYFKLHNGTDRTVDLVAVKAPGFGKVMLHESIEKNGTERMLHVSDIRVAPGNDLIFAPGGYHIMFMQPRKHLKPGDRLPVTLIFANGRRLEQSFDVRGATGQ